MKILMVCLGNICRSPLAHGLLREKSKALGWEVDSAGTSYHHEGDKSDIRTRQIAKRNNLDISDLRSRPFVIEDFDAFDIIYGMDLSNVENILKMARNDKDRAKVKLILNEVSPGENREVPDPYFGGMHGFEQMHNLLDEATDIIIEKYGTN